MCWHCRGSRRSTKFGLASSTSHTLFVVNDAEGAAVAVCSSPVLVAEEVSVGGVAAWTVTVGVNAAISQRTPVQPAMQLHLNERCWLTHPSIKQLATPRSAACDARSSVNAQSATQSASTHPPGRISPRQLEAVPDEHPASAAQVAYSAMHCAEHGGASMNTSSQLIALGPQGVLAHVSGGAGLVIGLGSAVVAGDEHTAA